MQLEFFVHPNIDEVAQLNLAEPAEGSASGGGPQRRISGEAEA